MVMQNHQADRKIPYILIFRSAIFFTLQDPFINNLMNALHIFACSYGKFGTVHGPEAHEFRDAGSWSNILARRLRRKLINHSQPGSSNFVIFQNILNTLSSIDSDDLVIVNWSHINRAWLYRDQTLMPSAHVPNSRFVQDYYQYCYSDVQAAANLITFNYYVRQHMLCPCLWSTADSAHLIESQHSQFTVLDDPYFVHDSGITPVDYVRNQDVSHGLTFSCSHPSAKGHEFIADCFYSKIQSMGYI